MAGCLNVDGREQLHGGSTFLPLNWGGQQTKLASWGLPHNSGSGVRLVLISLGGVTLMS